jgi:hypothetical protein
VTAFTACLLIGLACGQDYLEGGNVQSSTRPSDPGIAEMVRWLDQPVPTFPWYSADGTFYQQGVPETTFTPFRDYYITTGAPVVEVGRRIGTPTRFDISQRTPTNVYYAAGQGLPYSQYASTVPSRANDLWVQGAGNWTQYVVVPVGTQLQLIAYVPVGGPGGVYEVVQTNASTLEYNTYQFYQGYNTMSFNADQVGRHMLYFVVNNQPSDVVVVDVFAQAPGGAITPA